jgi:hypothetical protein
MVKQCPRFDEIGGSFERVLPALLSSALFFQEDSKCTPLFNKIDRERRLVISPACDVLTMADSRTYQNQLLSDPDFDPGFSQLADFTHVTKFDIGMDDIRMLAQKSIFSPESRRAFVVKGDLAYGLARMFEILRETMGEQGIGVFRNLDDALEWVLAEKGTNPKMQ